MASKRSVEAHCLWAFKTEVDRLRAEYAAAAMDAGAVACCSKIVRSSPALACAQCARVSIVDQPDVAARRIVLPTWAVAGDLLVAASDRMQVTEGAALGRVRLIDTDSRIRRARRTSSRKMPSSTANAPAVYLRQHRQPKGCMLSNRYFLQVADWYLGQGGVPNCSRTAKSI